MIIDSQKFSSDQLYFLLIQTVIPRPIAWVLSDNGNDSFNLAPFSFFNAITSNPPILMISVGHKDDVARKDTWVNIEERSDFVVHLPSEDMAEDVVASSATLPHGVSEVEKLNLKLEKMEGMRLPKVVGPKIVFFCSKYAIHEIGNDPQGLILGEIKKIWVDDAIISEQKGRLIVDPLKLNPLARLGGSLYSTLGKTLTLKRPA